MQAFSIDPIFGIYTKQLVADDSKAHLEKLIEELHWEIQDWKSQFQAMDDSMIMLEEVLNSGVYRSNTLNLFERMQDYKTRMQAFKTVKYEIRQAISRHESQLGAVDIYSFIALEPGFSQDHDALKTSVENTLIQYHRIKTEILNYTEGLPKIPSGQGSS